MINVGKCLTIKGAEEILNRPYAFELSTSTETLFFIADSDKVRRTAPHSCQCSGWPWEATFPAVYGAGSSPSAELVQTAEAVSRRGPSAMSCGLWCQEKEDWINSVGRAIVKHSRSVTDYEVLDYDSKPAQSSQASTTSGSPAPKGSEAAGPPGDEQQDVK